MASNWPVFKFDFMFCVFLLLLACLTPSAISIKKVKWFAYCYFELGPDSLSITTLTCGKCIDEIISLENLENEHHYYPSSSNQQQKIRSRRDLNETSSSGEIKSEDDFATNQNITDESNLNQTDRSIRKSHSTTTPTIPTTTPNTPTPLPSPSIDSNSYCSYFKTVANSSLNRHEAVRLSNEREINMVPLVPVLSHDWYNFDLLYLIEKNEVSTNLHNLTFFSRIPETLKKIELIDFGIGSINFNAFRNFPQLQVIRLNNNNLNTVELSSFLTSSDEPATNTDNDGSEDDESEENSEQASSSSSSSSDSESSEGLLTRRPTVQNEARLVELDLSSNKLYNIKLENFIYLKSLRVLNLSNNFIRHFDLHFLSVVTPHLQVLDLSNNQIKRLKVVDHNLYFSSPSLLGAESSPPSYISLVTNLILNELVSLNLERNALSQLDHLFSISFSLINDSRFCNLSNSVSMTNSLANQRPTLAMNIRNNRWKCDCRTFELVESLQNIILSNYSNSSAESGYSCYLNYLAKENHFLFANLLNFTSQTDLSCYRKRSSFSWSTWYQEKCSNLSSESSSSLFKLLNQSIIQVNSTRTNYSGMISFKINSLFPFGGHQTVSFNRNPQLILTTRMSLLKYDITNLFYWISSICLSVVTISCLLLAWYYCWKRYQGQTTTVGQQAQAQSYRGEHQQRIITQPTRMVNHQPAATRRSDVYLLNSRPTRIAHSEAHNTGPSYLYQISLNRNAREELIRADRTRNVGNPGLYYISLNPNSSFRAGSSANSAATTASFINVGYQTSRNTARRDNNGIIDADDPPNYYEAILVGNNHMNTNRNIISNSLNKNQNSRHDMNTAESTAMAAMAAAASVRAAVEVERSNDATGMDADEITTSTTMTRTQEEEREDDEVNENEEMMGSSGGHEEPTTGVGVDYLDISMNDDDAGESNTTDAAAFFIEREASQRGRSTDV